MNCLFFWLKDQSISRSPNAPAHQNNICYYWNCLLNLCLKRIVKTGRCRLTPKEPSFSSNKTVSWRPRCLCAATHGKSSASIPDTSHPQHELQNFPLTCTQYSRQWRNEQLVEAPHCFSDDERNNLRPTFDVVRIIFGNMQTKQSKGSAAVLDRSVKEATWIIARASLSPHLKLEFDSTGSVWGSEPTARLEFGSIGALADVI